MIILDTNVVSEPWKPQPEMRVLRWLETQAFNSLYLSTPVLAELRFGAERLDAGVRRERLRALIDRLEQEGYRGRILSLDVIAAAEFGRLAAFRERIGKRMEPMDALIAAIASANRAVLATRDIDHFTDLGLELVNPFDFAS